MSDGKYLPDVLDRSMVTDQCWLWLGSVSTKGYGQITRDGRHIQVHRIAFESEYGDIPDGMVVDHLCHDPKVCAGGNCPHRRCVNPAHLQATTNSRNLKRQTPAAKTHCKNGHELAGANLKRSADGRRICVTCKAASMARYRAADNHETPTIRRWARENGIPVSQRGRISVAVVEAYRQQKRMAA